MSTSTTPRPWYCHDGLVEDYIAIDANGGDLRMLKTAKVVRSIVVNVGVIAISLYSLALGAEPTVVATLALPTLALYNGLEAGDYRALVQAILEVSQETSDDES